MVDSAILEMNYADYKGNLTDLIYYHEFEWLFCFELKVKGKLK